MFCESVSVILHIPWGMSTTEKGTVLLGSLYDQATSSLMEDSGLSKEVKFLEAWR